MFWRSILFLLLITGSIALAGQQFHDGCQARIYENQRLVNAGAPADGYGAFVKAVTDAGLAVKTARITTGIVWYTVSTEEARLAYKNTRHHIEQFAALPSQEAASRPIPLVRDWGRYCQLTSFWRYSTGLRDIALSDVQRALTDFLAQVLVQVPADQGGLLASDGGQSSTDTRRGMELARAVVGERQAQLALAGVRGEGAAAFPMLRVAPDWPREPVVWSDKVDMFIVRWVHGWFAAVMRGGAINGDPDHQIWAWHRVAGYPRDVLSEGWWDINAPEAGGYQILVRYFLDAAFVPDVVEQAAQNRAMMQVISRGHDDVTGVNPLREASCWPGR